MFSYTPAFTTGSSGTDYKAAPILIVDDSLVNRMLVSALLEDAGFSNIRHAVDGREALDLIAGHNFDLIILDIVMPHIDGLEVMRRIRAEKRTADLPVLIQSAADEVLGRATIFETGATDIVSKPINPGELVARCGLLLERRLMIRRMNRYQDRIQSELAAATRMQFSLLPSQQQLNWCKTATGLDVGARLEPSSELGGDLWGICEVGDNQAGIFTLDISGHGIAAALNVFRIHALLQEFRELRGRPAELLRALNARLFVLLPRGTFATMFYGVISPARNLLTYASAGAPMPIIAERERAPLAFHDGAGVPLGIRKDTEYVSHEVAFHPGAALLLYSDGFPDAVDSSGERLGDASLISVAQPLFSNSSTSQSTVDQLWDRLLSDAVLPVGDDLTAVCVVRR